MQEIAAERTRLEQEGRRLQMRVRRYGMNGRRGTDRQWCLLYTCEQAFLIVLSVSGLAWPFVIQGPAVSSRVLRWRTPATRSRLSERYSRVACSEDLVPSSINLSESRRLGRDVRRQRIMAAPAAIRMTRRQAGDSWTRGLRLATVMCRAKGYSISRWRS